MKPLAGVRVLDLTQAMAAPYCTLTLASMGADVTKIEPPGGEETRRGSVQRHGHSGTFIAMNTGKRSLVVDLKTEEGVQIVRRLATAADVFVQNYRPGAASRLGVAWEQLRTVNPALIYCSISGFGSTGPYAARGGYDLIAQGMSGIMSVTGDEDGPPAKAGIPLSDLAAGLFGAYGILCALEYRAVTGEGQFVETSLQEAALALTVWESAEYWATGNTPRALGSAHRLSAPYQAIRASDGWFTVGANNDKLFEALCRAIDRLELLTDSRFNARLVVRPAFPVGKVPPLEVGTKGGDQIVREMREISDERHFLPAPRVTVEAQAVLSGAERSTPRDRLAVVHDDGQVAASSPHRHVGVVAERADRPLQSVGLLWAGLDQRATVARRHRRGLSRRLCQGHLRTSLQRIAGERPPERMRPVAVPGSDELQDRRAERGSRAEAAVAQALTLQEAEPQLHLVHPGGMLGRVVEDEALAVAGVERTPPPLLTIEVNVQVIPDDMDGPGRVAHRELLHERHQIGRRPRRSARAHDLAPVHLKGAEQRLRAVPGVFELPPPGPARGGRAIRKAPLPGLHAGLFVDRQDDGAGRGMQIQVGNLGDLRPELGIGTVQPALDAVRSQVAVGQDALIAAPTDALHDATRGGFLDQRRNRARRLALRPCYGLAGQSDQLGAGDGAELRRRARPRPVLQPRQPLALKSPPPALDRTGMDAQPPRDGASTLTLFTGQDDPRPHGIALETRPGSNPTLEFGTLLLAQRDSAARPAATQHAATASRRTLRDQTSCSTRGRSAPTDFPGRINGSDH